MRELARGFSRQHRIMESPSTGSHHLSPLMADGFTYPPGYRLTPVLPLTGPTTFLRHPIAWLLPDQVPRIHPHTRRSGTEGFWVVSLTDSPRTRPHGYGNINPLSIDYACRPRLRSRLTLGGLTCPRNPWSSGGRVSHSAFATHACILTPTPSTTRSHGCFPGCRTLPYPPQPLHTPPKRCADVMLECRGFGGVLEPRYIIGAGPLDQ